MAERLGGRGDGRLWHNADVPECPRNVRYCSKTGSDVLVMSLTGLDPELTQAGWKSCNAATLRDMHRSAQSMTEHHGSFLRASVEDGFEISRCGIA